MDDRTLSGSFAMYATLAYTSIGLSGQAFRIVRTGDKPSTLLITLIVVCFGSWVFWSRGRHPCVFWPNLLGVVGAIGILLLIAMA